ncbi:MAG: amidase [Pseudomonadota bacterium]
MASLSNEPWRLTASEMAAKIKAGELTSEALVQSCLDRITARDAEVEAWIHLNPELALAQARAADAMSAAGHGDGPLHGVPVGIKDIIETADMPTQNGYRGHEGRHTHRDAMCVSLLRDAGAVILGKTVTTELAVRTPGKTKNPHDPAHTPGGSSSGSAAAVADGQVPLALGTQTGGSVIRPASFCGIFGYKPTFGLVPRTGVTMQAPWLDTVGTYGRTLWDAALVGEVMMAARDLNDPQALARSRPDLTGALGRGRDKAPKIAFARTDVWDKADPAAQKAIEAFATDLDVAKPVDLPDWLAEAWEWQSICQTYGGAMCYGPLLDQHGDLMSESLRDAVGRGRQITEAQYRHAIAQRDRVNAALAEVYADYDAILCLPSAGAAPEGLGWTGDPVFNAFWTYAGTPCVTLPLLQVDNMPMGVQLTGPRMGDARLMATADWLWNHAT